MAVFLHAPFRLGAGEAAEGREGEGEGSYWPICWQQLLSSCFQKTLAKAQLLKVVIYSLWNSHGTEGRGECINKLVNII